MIQCELQAQARLDDYLQAVRTSLRRCRSLDPAEVERDVRARIESELVDAPRPVPLDFLQPVLDRLGSPTQWVPDAERPRWWRALSRLQGGPEGAVIWSFSTKALDVADLFTDPDVRRETAVVDG